jgi:hypothetical protein
MSGASWCSPNHLPALTDRVLRLSPSLLSSVRTTPWRGCRRTCYDRGPRLANSRLSPLELVHVPGQCGCRMNGTVHVHHDRKPSVNVPDLPHDHSYEKDQTHPMGHCFS